MTVAALWNRENLAWAAGLLEGEGWFRVSHCKKGEGYDYLTLGCSMTDEDTVRRLAEIAGFGKVYTRTQRKGASGRTGKQQWDWRSSKAIHVYAFCVAIYPWMFSRRQAKIRTLLQVFRTLSGSGHARRSKAPWLQGLIQAGEQL